MAVSDDRTLNEEDLKGFAWSIANNAIYAGEVANRNLIGIGHHWRTFIYDEALSKLKTVVQHERQQAGRPLPDWFKTTV
jgi:hypothetical protein